MSSGKKAPAPPTKKRKLNEVQELMYTEECDEDVQEEKTAPAASEDADTIPLGGLDDDDEHDGYFVEVDTSPIAIDSEEYFLVSLPFVSHIPEPKPIITRMGSVTSDGQEWVVLFTDVEKYVGDKWRMMAYKLFNKTKSDEAFKKWVASRREVGGYRKKKDL